MSTWSVSCDFDGTITCEDVVNAILARFALPEWLDVEAQWVAGEIGSRACLERQTKLLRVSDVELAAWVDQVAVDSHVADLFADFAARETPVTILSDGYDWVIRRVMARLGLSHTPVIANRLTYAGDGRWSVAFPYATAACGSGVCKCAAAQGALRLHIGDGRSDICVADACDLVFAKAHLLESRRSRNLPCIGFETFADICATLPSALAAAALSPKTRSPATPARRTA